MHRAPDADDDELMAVVTRKVRQTRGKIWLGEDALDERPAAKKVKRNGPSSNGVDGEVERKRSSQARRPSADSCDTFLDPLEPTYRHLRDSHNSRYRASLSFGFDDEEDDRIMNQAAAAAAAAHDHHGSVYHHGHGSGSLDVRTEDMVDAVVAAVTASEEERCPSIHGPDDARLERGVQSRPRVAVTRRVKTFAAAEDVVEVVGGKDCVSAERCVDLAREEEEEEEEEEGGGAEEIEVATYASARPIHRSIADALGAELRSEGIVVDEDSDDAADDAIDFFKSGDTNVAVKEEATTREDSHERLEPVSERLAAALSRAVRSSNPGVTRVVLSVKAGSAGAVPRRDSDGSPDGSLNSARRRSEGARQPRTRTRWRFPRPAGRSPSAAWRRRRSLRGCARGAAKARRRARVRWCSAGDDDSPTIRFFFLCIAVRVTRAVERDAFRAATSPRTLYKRYVRRTILRDSLTFTKVKVTLSRTTPQSRVQRRVDQHALLRVRLALAVRGHASRAVVRRRRARPGARVHRDRPKVHRRVQLAVHVQVVDERG